MTTTQEIRDEGLRRMGISFKQPSLTIQFSAGGGEYVLPDYNDEEIEAVRIRVEKRLGRFLPEDPRTGFPSFTIYADGEEVGGG